MTEEMKRELLRDYENKSITVGEIAEKYGINRAVVARIAVEMGGATSMCEKVRQTSRRKKQGLPEV